MEFLDTFFNSKQAWVYLVSGELGLLFSICYTVLREDHKFKRLKLFKFITKLFSDFIKFIAKFLILSIPVSMFAITIDFSPIVAFFIGVAVERVLEAVDKKVLPRFSEGVADTLIKMMPLMSETTETKKLPANEQQETKDG